MKKLKPILFLMMSSLAFTNSFAIDLGVKAKIFKIEEQDLRITLMEMVANKINVEDHQKEMVEKADKFYRELPKFNLPISRKFEVSYVDPTKVYEQDYWTITKDDNGNRKWVKSVEAGQEVNWLEHYYSPTSIYFVFDYQSSIQRNIALEIAKVNNPFLKVVFAGGDIKSANEFLKYPLTYLNDELVREYDIKYTPSVIKRGAGEFINQYKVVRFNVDEMTVDQVKGEINDE